MGWGVGEGRFRGGRTRAGCHSGGVSKWVECFTQACGRLNTLNAIHARHRRRPLHAHAGAETHMHEQKACRQAGRTQAVPTRPRTTSGLAHLPAPKRCARLPESPKCQVARIK